jgi:hypothetical protein
MHGFLNLFAAAAFAYCGMGLRSIVELLEERDASSLRFSDDELRWNSQRITTGEVQAARREFAHSFGSCSFEEPVTELRELGLLP